jgi:hypothetical protein
VHGFHRLGRSSFDTGFASVLDRACRRRPRPVTRGIRGKVQDFLQRKPGRGGAQRHSQGWLSASRKQRRGGHSSMTDSSEDGHSTEARTRASGYLVEHHLQLVSMHVRALAPGPSLLVMLGFPARMATRFFWPRTHPGTILSHEVENPHKNH